MFLAPKNTVPDSAHDQRPPAYVKREDPAANRQHRSSNRDMTHEDEAPTQTSPRGKRPKPRPV